MSKRRYVAHQKSSMNPDAFNSTYWLDRYESAKVAFIALNGKPAFDTWHRQIVEPDVKAYNLKTWRDYALLLEGELS